MLLLAGCASPAARVDRLAEQWGLEPAWVEGEGFQHRVYRKPGQPTQGPVHVYIEHDGLPWRTETEVSADPTPRNPLMLRLMAEDPAPSIYLGRPCYFGTAAAPGCNALMWTHARYSEHVVNSMLAALRQLLKPGQDIILLGYSGGGALAMLLAEHAPNTRAVVTLAGNLDTDAWALYHAYTPLSRSLNPATRPPLDPGIIQRHYLGSADHHVPPAVVKRFTDRSRAGEVIEIPQFDHVCCWETIWPQILAEVDHAVETAQTARARP
jgi:dienelactone hydrolase